MNKGQTVFLVDDDPGILKALSRLLRASGYTAEAFGSAQEFMDSYNPGAAGCLVLDLLMPGITGLDLQQWLARSGSSLPIIFLTALDDIPECVKSVKEATAVLRKPVGASVLIKAVEDALARDRGARKACRL